VAGGHTHPVPGRSAIAALSRTVPQMNVLILFPGEDDDAAARHADHLRLRRALLAR